MKGRVRVLHNAVASDAGPDARDVLTQVGEVSAALDSLGYRPQALPVGLDLGAVRDILRATPPAFAFNLVEELGGHPELIAAVPMLLEALGVPYTGAAPGAMLLTSNKLLAKQRLDAHALPTPPWFDREPRAGAPDGRWIVKPVWEDASVGLSDASVVASAAAARERLAQCRAGGGSWFAERYVEGREINVSLLADGGGVQVLPVAEIRFVDFPAHKPRIVGYDAKWREDSFEYRHTPRDFAIARGEPALRARLERLARACWAAFELRGYARVDLRVDERGEPWVLEVNANPCLSADAGFAAALAAAGIGFEEAIARIIRTVPGLEG
jgi:D-alanine-D-alanine ligase